MSVANVEQLNSSEWHLFFVTSLLCYKEEEKDRSERDQDYGRMPSTRKGAILVIFIIFSHLKKDARKLFQYFRTSKPKFIELLDIIRLLDIRHNIKIKFR